MKPNVAAALEALSHLDTTVNPAALKAQSRDFFWYSPVLKARLDGVVADFAVSPATEEEVIEVLRTCYAHDCPVTTRGAGTGNYGQAMPLAGGCVLNLRKLNRVKEILPGRLIVEPGAILKDIDAATRAHSGQELRMFSSTWATASIGGFIAGGSGGVGSVRWGSLRDLGNIIRLRVVTMEAEPRVLEFRGEELARVSHAYGTNGIITELEMPLAPAYDWVDLMVAFDDFAEAARYADALASEDGILIKLATVIEGPAPARYFQRLKGRVRDDQSLVLLMVAPHAMDAFETFTARRPAASLLYRSDDCDWERGPGMVFEYAWNHTTLRALKVDPAITYLQVRYAFPDHLERVEEVRRVFGEEVLQHLEFMRTNGKVHAAGLSLVRFTTEERLDEIVRLHEEMGCMIFNPHRYTLEEGGRQSVDAIQLGFKREADPKGLLNPGKMITWEDPDWTYDRMYAYPGLKEQAE
ncbi:FAD-binding oxidoreductase [Oceanicella sp. SM1341]|uniref:FAD-binding oxidoreductase n=1 Tax=Oceanicella sp. SM1341 TaxID=1548889 RepID=UPI000E51E725|nr:FAD-binding oxidoreductase [Oceanicella sp. SM1341]